MRNRAAPMIYLAITDDWELRGDGSGDIEKLQFESMDRLIGILERFGLKGTFYVEVGQQLAFRRNQDRNPELARAATEWEERVSRALGRGFDVQLHLHPQWFDSRYHNGRWDLRGKWELFEYSQEQALNMLQVSKEYLERLSRRENPEHSIVAFRAGGWCFAPSEHLLGSLVRLGIQIDCSIIQGLRIETATRSVDYSDVDEGFLPYYPRMDDARRVSSGQEPIICVPTAHFHARRRCLVRQLVKRGAKYFGQKLSVANPVHGRARDPSAIKNVSDPLPRAWNRIFSTCSSPSFRVADIANLEYPLLREMLHAIRIKARRSGAERVPVVIGCHTKDLRDFSSVERFALELSRSEDIKTITLSELSSMLRQGFFHVRQADETGTVGRSAGGGG